MISIVTAYYNRKKLFLRTLNSLKPSYGKIDFEVIAVDDGSDEKERIEDLQIEFPFLKVIRLEKNTKWYSNSCIPFNIGFANVKGDKIIIQNPECYHYDNILEYVSENLCNNQYLSFGCFSLDKEQTDDDKTFFDKENIDCLIESNNKTVVDDGDLGWYNHSKHRPEAFHFCSAIKTIDLYDLGGFDERYALGVGFDDNEFVYRIKSKKMQVVFVDEKIVLHQNHYSVKECSAQIVDKSEIYRRNRFLFSNVTTNRRFWKVNYLENKYFSENNTLTQESNFILEFNDLSQKLVKYKTSRRIAIIIARILLKLKL